MNTQGNTPLWLDLSKEDIDDNLEELQGYLKNCVAQKTKDSSYSKAIDLLRLRIEDLLNTLSMRPMYEEDGVDRNLTIFNVKLLAIYLLADGSGTLALPAYIAFMGELSTLSPRMSNTILKATRARLWHEKVSNLGFNWQDTENIGTELFAYKAATSVSFEQLLQQPMVYSNHGTAFATSQGLFLTYFPKSECKKWFSSGADSIKTDFGISLRTANNEKLKQSESNNIVAMDEFTDSFIQLQAKVKNRKVSDYKRDYCEGDETIVRVASIGDDGVIHVETLDPKYNKLSGRIVFGKDSLVYYRTNTLYSYFRPGDYLTATVVDGERATFSIDNQLVDFFVEDMKASDTYQLLAKVIDVRPNFLVWLSEYGIAVYTNKTGNYGRGDYAYLSVIRYGTGPFYGKIDAEVVGDPDDYFDEKVVRKDCIRAFAENTEAPAVEKQEEKFIDLNPVVIRLIARQIFIYQKTLLKPSDRFRYLCNANVMAELVGDKISSSYIRFARGFLRALVQFVRKEDISNVRLIPETEFRKATSTLVRLSVIDLLKEYGKKENSEKLADTIETFENSLPMLAKLARLIQTANSMQGTLSDASINVIRREIIKTLSLETENDADFEADGGVYLGVESGTQEFKTSMIYPPDNQMQHNEKKQNQNVLKGVCAFLNSTTGGTLYLGVNDQGNITGISNDMKYLKMENIDSYMRYVQDVAKKYFGIDTLPYLRIEPLYDNSVVAIHVEPHPYRVVELDKTAYLRINAESREMPEKVREELIARKVFTNKDKAAAVSRLQHACTQRKCVILHDYASSNSGKVSDRFVEAYNVLPEDDLVVCLDRNKFTIKIFSINRIGYVEILENEPWKYQASHKKINVDVFHMTGDSPVHVSLQLDLMAKNLLIEEYPSSKNFIKSHKGDDNIWYFDTNVYKLEGVGRFYMGLANHIKILDAPELQSYVKEFARQFF